MSPYRYRDGLKDGLPIGLGYLSVSFGFAIWAIRQGLPKLFTILVSATNLTSAGQVAGVVIMASGGLLMEMAATQFVINLRYSLMSISLTQKLEDGFHTGKRLLAAYFITDEIFAVASTKKDRIGLPYLLGLGTLPWLGWVCGTALGAFAGDLLPATLCAALDIAIYGMFLAIFLPACRDEFGVLIAVGLSIAVGCILRYVPWFSFLSEGFVIILAAIVGAVVAAWLRPISEEVEQP